MKREKIKRVYSLCRREEKERASRVRKICQGTECLYYVLMVVSIITIVLIDESNIMLLFGQCLIFNVSIITMLYFNPLLYEKEGAKNEVLLKKYLYIPLDLRELCLAKIIVFGLKTGKIYLIHLGIILAINLIYSDWKILFLKVTVLTICMGGMCICFMVTILMQYLRIGTTAY